MKRNLSTLLLFVSFLLACLVVTAAQATTPEPAKRHPSRSLPVKWGIRTTATQFSQPAIADGKVIIIGADGHAVAYDKNSGKQVWRSEKLGTNYYYTIVKVTQPPAVTSHSIVIPEVSNDRTFAIVAVDRDTGRTKWQIPWELYKEDTVTYAAYPVTKDDLFYYAASTATSFMLNAADEADGHRVWSTKVDFPIFALKREGASVYALLVSGDQYVAQNSVAAFDAQTGELKWQTQLRKYDMYTMIETGDGGLFTMDARKIYRLDLRTGEVIWQTPWDPSIETLDNPSFLKYINGVLYVNKNERLLAMDPGDGSILWSAETRGTVSTQVAATDTLVFVGTKKGYFQALDAKTGQEKWNFGFPQTVGPWSTGQLSDTPVGVSPVVEDGTLYMEDYNTYYRGISALKLP